MMSGPVILHRNGQAYIVKVKPATARPLEVYDGTRRVAFGLLKRYHPWRLEVADVDGHGEAIAVGVDKPTHNLRFRHRTLFLINFDGHALQRKWTGSSLGRPLLDFCFSPTVPQHLVSLERCLDGRVAVTAYHWVGFGFRKDGERLLTDASAIEPVPEGVRVRAGDHQVSFTWKDLRL